MRTGKETLIEQAAYAWSHYRHIEETRRNYLAFHVATILGSLVFLATLAKGLTEADHGFLAWVVTVYLTVLFGFSFLVWANVLRMGYVLDAYEDIMRETRKVLFAGDEETMQLWTVRDRLPPVVSWGIFCPQRAAIWLTLGSCVAICFAQGVLTTIVFCGSIQARHWEPSRVVFTLLLIIMLTGIGFAYKWMRKAKVEREGKSKQIPDLTPQTSTLSSS